MMPNLKVQPSPEPPGHLNCAHSQQNQPFPPSFILPPPPIRYSAPFVLTRVQQHILLTTLISPKSVVPKHNSRFGAPQHSTRQKQRPRSPPVIQMATSQQQHHQQHQQQQQPSPSPVLKELALSLDKAHNALSDITAVPFSGTQQALDQTNAHLQATTRYLADSTQNLTRFQANLLTLRTRIKDAREFLPVDPSYRDLDSDTHKGPI